jgi:hypothetical protein
MTEPIHTIHPQLWERLSQLNPAEVCRRSGAQFDEGLGSYSIDYLQERYRISPRGRTIEAVSGPLFHEDPSIELKVILITYLLNAQEVPLADKLVAGSSLTGGKNFFRGSHRFPLDPLIERYGRDVEGFFDRGLSLGATQERYGDVGLRFVALPRVPVIMVLWGADEEFPARLSVLFDASIEQHLPLDAIYGLVTDICRRLSSL